MNTLQLEQLISGYIDNELSSGRKQEVENLLQLDPAAKKLYEEFLAIRKEIRHTRRHNLPHDFQKNLFNRIDRETVSISGKLVEQTTSVDFTSPVKAKASPDRNKSNGKLSRSVLLSRLKNPVVWGIPAAVLLIGIVFFAANFGGKDQQTAFVSPEQPTGGATEEIYVPPRPLSDGGSIPESGANHALMMKDGKPIVEVMLELSPTARDNEYVAKLLADNGYSFAMRENGNKAVTVYEFEMQMDQLLPLIAMMYANREEIKSYKLPDAILPLLQRTSASSDTLSETPPSTIIVRLNVSKDK